MSLIPAFCSRSELRVVFAQGGQERNGFAGGRIVVLPDTRTRPEPV
jgi:hypothetical protein